MKEEGKEEEEGQGEGKNWGKGESHTLQLCQLETSVNAPSIFILRFSKTVHPLGICQNFSYRA